MKILEIIATLGIGGAEALVTDLSMQLSKMGENVKLYLLGGVHGDRGELLARRLEFAGVEVIGKAPRMAKSVRNLTKLASTVRRYRPDIVHCHMYTSEVAYMLGQCFSFYRGASSVRTLHSTDVFSHRSRLVYRKLAASFDMTVACADVVRSAFELSAIGWNGAQKLVTIQNGCTLSQADTTQEEKEAARNALDLPPDALIISHVGTFRGPSLEVAPKGHDTALKAFSQAFGSEKNTLLVCAGDGSLRGEAEKFADRLGIADRVRFLGNVSEPWPVLKAADIFLFPSRFEGLPLSLVEAGSVGIPVIASDIPEIRSVYDGPGWHFCPAGNADAFSDALLRVSGALTQHAAVAKSGSAQIRDRYAITTCAGRYLALFRNMRNIANG